MLMMSSKSTMLRLSSDPKNIAKIENHEINVNDDLSAKMWINKKLVYNLHVGRNAVADQEVLNVMLTRGVNKILVKVENLGANWGLFLRIIDPKNELKIEQFN